MLHDNIHYDMRKARSYNCSFNLIVGPRGPGKTFELTQYVVEDFIKRGAQFKWVRRYPKEIKAVRGSFFDDMIKLNVFPDHELKMTGNKAMIDGKLAGKIIALSTGDDEKSTPTPEVNTIVFDEFILEPGFRHYIPNEVHTFLNLVNSTVRLRSGWSVWMLANAVTMANPYFDYWGVRLPYGKSISRFAPDKLIEYVQNDAFEAAAASSQFGQAVAGTEYADYAVKNRFFLDNDTFIERKTATSKYYFTIRFHGKEYGIYADFETGILYVSQDADRTFPVRFALTDDDHNPNTLIVRGRRNPYITALINCYAAGALRFDNARVKGAMLKAIALLR
ncbi:MAG: phage DNA encapsidation protein [Kiritimatiellae bacterium]|nr:phage DNA encapsidation protein [Kiritimatiellia bacterium]